MPRRNIARQRRAKCTSIIILESTNRKKKLAGTSGYKNAAFGLLMASITAFSAGHATGAPDPQEAGTSAAHDRVAPGSIPEALQGGAWQQISSQIEDDRHRIREHNGNWRAHTPGQRYSTTFGPDGPNLEVQDGERHHTVGFRFRSALVDGQPVATQSPEQLAEANRMSYQRGGLTEWYVNRPEGLEQGFTIDEAPDGEVLHIEMSVDSDLTPALATNTLLLSDNGRIVFRYAGLKAWDATGGPLAAQMALNRSRLTLEVNIKDARYPITVDPVMFNEVAKVTPDRSSDAFGHPGDLAGRSVSIDGDRALIGAAGSFDDDSPYNEEAFVFERDAGSGEWEFVAQLAPNDTNSSRWFGNSVSLSGDRALVGAMRDDENGPESGSAYIFVFDGTDWIETEKLLPSDPTEYERFGIAVSLQGNRALVGARGSNSTYVFDFDSVAWNETGRLQPEEDIENNGFGYPLALTGNRALVGAAFDSENGTNSGSAYVFEFNGTDWHQMDKLQPGDGDEAEFFGVSISLSDDLALIGAPHDEDNGPQSGSVYIFENDGTDWNETAKLLPGDGAEDDEFGLVVSLSGTRALVGTYGSGSAYIFDFDGTTWAETGKLEPKDGSGTDRFGYAVDLSGDRALVGAPWDDDHGDGLGSAYVFDFSTEGWNETSKLLAPGDEARDDLFGQSVSLSGNRALIGAYGDEDNGLYSGSAYLFEFEGGHWNKTATLLPGDGAATDRFGYAVSLAGDRALIGAPGNDDSGPASGSAYIFDFDGDEWSETAKLLAGDGAENDRFGHAVGLSADRALIGAFGNGDNGLESGSAYIFEFNGASWTETFELLPEDGAEEEHFGYAVSLLGDRALVGAPGPLRQFGYTTPGAGYIFHFNGTQWSETDKLAASDGDAGDEFGRAVSLSGDRALVGAPKSDSSSYQSGAAYIFSFNGTEWSEHFKLIPEKGLQAVDFGGAVSLSGDQALVGATYGEFGPGAAHVFELSGANWLEVDKLLPGQWGEEFGPAVSLSGYHAIIGMPGDDEIGPDSGAAYLYLVTEIFSDQFED
ncbi:MAG: hypothetical protein U5L08_09210 [Xanthomonadales bacterium]|nr:hypothetical protein [Xanthomonadales bacterium]